VSDDQSSSNSERVSPITRWLANVPSGVLVAYGGLMAFGTYFCMYAFRKPFQAVTYEALGQQFNIDMKIVFVLSQLFGYLISKYVGIEICSEIKKKWRLPLMIGLILFAELSLVFFGLVPLNSGNTTSQTRCSSRVSRRRTRPACCCYTCGCSAGSWAFGPGPARPRRSPT